MVERIKSELQKRLEESADGFIGISMRKSGDKVLITASSTDYSSPTTAYEIMSFKLQKIYVLGLDELAEIIADYDHQVEEQQNIISLLYSFKREKLDTGLATETEKNKYAEVYQSIFGYNPLAA